MNRKNGFTLIELLVTISILATLSTIAMVIYGGVTAKARDSQRIKDLQAIKQALELYRSDIHNYPPSSAGSNHFVLSSAISLTNCTGLSSCTLTSTYLNQVPKDVMSSRNYFYSASPLNCDNSSSANTCSDFTLCAKKESTSTTSYDLPDCNSSTCGSAGNCDIGVSSQ